MFSGWFDLWLSMVLPAPPPPARDRLAGSMIGLALGDALGYVVEGHSRQVCLDYVEEVIRTDRVGTVGRSPHSFGQYTDDSQLTRELVRSIIASEGFDPEDYAGRLSELFSEQRVVGRGQATAEAAARLAHGVHWTASGVPAPYAGNGAAMRAAPIGWLYSRQEAAMVRTAQEQARITHTDPRAVAGSVAIAGAVALALRASPRGLRPESMLDSLVRWVTPVEPAFAAEIDNLRNVLRRQPDDAVWLISRAGRQRGQGHQARWRAADDAISPYVVPSVLWSLYSFLRCPNHYLDAICTAISGGGDADTTAAMTGAISGAYLGLDALPRGLARQLHDQGSWDYEALLGLVENFPIVDSRLRSVRRQPAATVSSLRTGSSPLTT